MLRSPTHSVATQTKCSLSKSTSARRSKQFASTQRLKAVRVVRHAKKGTSTRFQFLASVDSRKLEQFLSAQTGGWNREVPSSDSRLESSVAVLTPVLHQKVQKNCRQHVCARTALFPQQSGVSYPVPLRKTVGSKRWTKNNPVVRGNRFFLCRERKLFVPTFPSCYCRKTETLWAKTREASDNIVQILLRKISTIFFPDIVKIVKIIILKCVFGRFPVLFSSWELL